MQFLPCFEYYSSEKNTKSEGERYRNSLGAVGGGESKERHYIQEPNLNK